MKLKTDLKLSILNLFLYLTDIEFSTDHQRHIYSIIQCQNFLRMIKKFDQLLKISV